MNVLSDPSIPIRDLISFREIVKCLQLGMLTQSEAAKAISRVSPKFADCSIDIATAAAVIEALEAVLRARSPGAARMSHSERLRLKAVECLQLADNARHLQTQNTYKSLARCYEQMAVHVEEVEQHQYEQMISKAKLKP